LPLRDPVLLCGAGFTLLAIASYGFWVFDLISAVFEPGLAYTLVDRDFVNYWMGGQLALSGEHLDLFVHERYFPRLQELFGADYEVRAWSYPPHYLLFLWPLGLAGYKAGFIGFIGGTLLAFVFAAWVFKREFAPQADSRLLVLALTGYVLMMLYAAQNGFMTGAALLLGLAWMKNRPLLAGLAFACLTVKPQLVLLIPVLLVFDRNWLALFWSAVFTVLLALVSVAWFGLESWVLYATETLAYQQFVMTNWYDIFLRMMPTVFGSVRTLEFSPAVAAQAQLPVTLAAAATILWLLYRERDPLRRVFTVTCGAFLITPYAFNYDMGALTVAAALLAARRADGDSRFAVPVAMVAMMSAACMNLGRANLPITPLVLAAGLAALVFAARRVSRDPAHETLASVPTGN
jgi:hypothetical protein